MHDFLLFLKGFTILGVTCVISLGLVLALLWILSLDEHPARIDPCWWLPLAWPILPFLRLLGYTFATSERSQGRRLDTAPVQRRRKAIRSVQQAKEFLANRIAAEAEREGSPLTEVERKMLFFSEAGWTQPDMAQVSAEFDRDYDQDAYEQKVAGLIRKIDAKHSAGQTETETWDEAVEKLSDGDHYLTLLINMGNAPEILRQGFLPTLSKPSVRQPHDVLKLWVTALVLLFGGVLFATCWTWIYWHAGPAFRTFSDWMFDNRDRRLLAALFILLLFAFGLRFRRVVGAFSKRK